MQYGLYTFNSTNSAMRAELVVNKKVKSRLIPLPVEISAGCGLALRFEKKYKKDVEEIFQKQNLDYKNRYMLDYPQNQRKARVKDYDLL